MKLNNQLLIPLLLLLTACGGGSSGDGATDQSSDGTPVPVFGLGPTSPEILASMEHILVEEYTSPDDDGVIFDITRFSLDETKNSAATVHMRITNNSERVVAGNAGCNVNANKGGELVNVAVPRFASNIFLDPGESTITSERWIKIPEDFAGMDNVDVVLCEWKLAIDQRIDIATDSVKIEFIGFSDNSSSPEVRLLLTNNSPDTIYSIDCNVDAKVGDLIVDTATVRFDLVDIAPDEAVEDVGHYFAIESLNEFESDSFDMKNLGCSYSVRS